MINRQKYKIKRRYIKKFLFRLKFLMKIKCKRIKVFDVLSEEFLIIKVKFFKLVKLYRVLLSINDI